MTAHKNEMTEKLIIILASLYSLSLKTQIIIKCQPTLAKS